MNTLLFLVNLFSLLIYANCVPPTQVIEITTWDPIDTKDITMVNMPKDFINLLEESFKSGKTLVDADKLGFYDKLTEQDVKFFSPNKFVSYALSYAHFEGLLSKETSKTFPVVENTINQMKLRKIDSEGGINSLDVHDRNIDNIFFIIDSSVLLESPSFDCPNKKEQITNNKYNIPLSVSTLCSSVLKGDNRFGVPIQSLMDLYRTTEKNKNANILGLENCIEQFVFSVYYSNDVLLKLNAGELLTEINSIIDSKEKVAKFYSYNVPSEMFLAVLTAIQKAVHAAKNIDPALATKLYWSSLKKFNKKIYIEIYKDEQQKKAPELKIIIQGQSNQVLFPLGIPADIFKREINPFLIADYNEFQDTCEMISEPVIDLKQLLLKNDILDKVNTSRGPLFFIMLIIGIIVVVLVLNYKSTKKEISQEDKEIEFRRIVSSDMESQRSKTKKIGHNSFEDIDDSEYTI